MTVETQAVKVTVNGNDVATSFSFSPLVIYFSADIVVYHIDAAGVRTLKTEGTGATNYSVNITTYPATGSIVYPADEVTPLPSGESLLMKRVMTLEQATDLENQGGYFAQTQEDVYDKGIMIDLQQQEELNRTIQVPIEDTVVSLELPLAADRANKALTFTATGAVTATTAGGGLANIVEDTTPQLGGTLDTNGNNITMTGAQTVDGRDLSVDGTKLDTIETSATADQSAAEILTALLGVDGTGTLLDADLLDGNEATAFATAAQGATADTALQNVVEDTTPQLGGNLDTLGNSIDINGGTLDINGGIFSLNGGTFTIGGGTFSDDGAGSGLDADLLDGIEGAGYSILGQIAGINAQVVSYTLVLTDKGKLVKVSNASANNLTVPLNATVAYPTNSVIHILQEGAGQTTVVATGGVTIRTPATLLLRGQYSMASLLKIGTDEWVLSGDLQAA